MSIHAIGHGLATYRRPWIGFDMGCERCDEMRVKRRSTWIIVGLAGARSRGTRSGLQARYVWEILIEKVGRDRKGGKKEMKEEERLGWSDVWVDMWKKLDRSGWNMDGLGADVDGWIFRCSLAYNSATYKLGLVCLYLECSTREPWPVNDH